jgi:hypothetical protein
MWLLAQGKIAEFWLQVGEKGDTFDEKKGRLVISDAT